MKVSLRKAHTACAMDRTTENFGEEIIRRQLQISYYGDPMFTALPGGIPIVGKDGAFSALKQPDQIFHRQPCPFVATDVEGYMTLMQHDGARAVIERLTHTMRHHHGGYTQ